MRIFIVIPAYNEAGKIGGVVTAVRKQGHKDVVVVDDGSGDDTAGVATEAGAVVISHLVNRGQGAALKTGTEYAIRRGADIIVHFDADGQFLAEEIRDMVKPVEKGEARVTLGSRFLGKKSDLPFLKRFIIMPLARLINRLLSGIKLTDPQNGFRVMTAEVARKIDWRSDRMAHCSEILFLLYHKGFRPKEIPVTVIYPDFGQRFGGGIRILKDLFLARLID